MTLITIRKGNSGQWSESNRILQTGEPGYDLSNKLLKIGDGISNWNNLSYYGSGLFSNINHSHSISDVTNFNSGVSGLLPNIVGSEYLVSNFNVNSYTLAVTGLQPSGNYANAVHSHVVSDINNFGSGVSGFLPVKNIVASTGISISEIDGVYSVAVTGNFGLGGSEIDSRVSGYLQPGSGIVFNYSNNTLVINSNLVSPPASSTSSGNIGQFAYDTEYFYVCISNNLWKRTSLNSW